MNNKLDKFLLDKNDHTIRAGSTVNHNGVWRWVKSVNMKRGTVNLTPVFGGKIVAKNVSIADVFEDGDAHLKWWSKTESYQSM